MIAFTTRKREGNARHPATLSRMLKKRGVPNTLASGKQVHGVRIAVVPRLTKPKQYTGYDGFLTAEPRQPLGIFTADCASIFLSAPSQGVIGLLHAGWRGVHGKILLHALREVSRRWKCPARDVQVWIGPSIGPCCFEVRWDVARYFPSTRKRKGTRWVVDIHREIERQVRHLGARLVKAPRACTHHRREYHSFRRDKTDERQISVFMRQK